MALEDLTELEKRLFEYVKLNDFETNPWSTPNAARVLGVTEKEIYEALSNLTKHMKDNFQISYRDNALRVAAE